MNEIRKGKLLIIGLDAGTLDLVRPWAEAGFLPNMGRLIREGASGPLWSTIPTISPAAWISMITGKNPGQHGIYDFVQRAHDSYRIEYIKPNLPRLGTIFGYLSRLDRRVGVIGVPMTYPPEPVNGFMVSGPWAAENEACVYPHELFPFLKEHGYEINNSVAYSPETAQEFWDYLVEVTDTRASVALELLRRESWDLFMVVFRDTDTVASFYWHDMDASHPQHNPERAQQFGNCIRDHYRQLDAYIGKMLDVIDDQTYVMIVSDHGSGGLVSEISLNKWLLDLGLLRLKDQTSFEDNYRSILRKLGVTRSGIIKRFGWPFVNRVKRMLPNWAERLVPWPHAQLNEQVDWQNTKAYSFGSVGQIHINLKGREPQGIVEPGAEYEALIADIVSQLEQLVDPRTGKKVKTEVFRPGELYHGPYSKLAPDLNVIFDDMSCITHITLEAVRDELFTLPADFETGFHRLNGMVVLWGPRIRKGVVDDAAKIVDVAPTALHLMGESVPDDIDGRVLEEFLESDFVAGNPVKKVRVARPVGEGQSTSWTQEEEEKIAQHLKDLGYME